MGLAATPAAPEEVITGVSMGLASPENRLPLQKPAWLLVVGILACHGTLLAFSADLQFPTRNEVAHLPAGLSHWSSGNFTLYKVDPPTWRMLATAPLLFCPVDTKCIQFPSSPEQRKEWETAGIFAKANLTSYWKLVFISRLAGIAWSLCGALAVYAWSRQLYGALAGYIALTLWCFDPNILAHAPLLTPDMPSTVMIFCCLWVFWRYVQAACWSLACLCGIALGVAILMKFTALLLYLILPIMWLVSRPCVRGPSILSSIAQMLAIVFVSVIVINCGYEFNSSCKQLGELPFVSTRLRGDPSDGMPYGNCFKETWLGTLPIPLPADFVCGIDLQYHDFERQLPSYLGGELKNGGWWYYYIYAFGLKEPVGTILLLLWALALAVARVPKTTSLIGDLFVWAPPIVILAFVSSQTGVNQHFRYVLPVLPFFFVGMSRLGAITGRWPYRLGSCVLIAWSTFSSLAVFPHSLSYFNELAGGPDWGSEYLIDSNIDWGQDLWFLKEWIQRHSEARPLAIAYSNYIDYRLAGLDFPRPPIGPPAGYVLGTQSLRRSIGPQAGYFAVDVYSLKNLGIYQYFNRFRPIAKAGYSIFIYHIEVDEANRVRQEMGLPPVTAGE